MQVTRLPIIFLAALVTTAACSPAAGQAERCPREIEVIVDAAEDTGLDAPFFVEVCGPAFDSDEVTLTTGLSEPDYVLAVQYDEWPQDGEMIGRVVAALGFTGGTIGEAQPLGGVDKPIMGYGQILAHDGYFGRDVSLQTIDTYMAPFGALVPTLVRENERIPESSRITLPSGCYRPNEAREITLVVPPGPHSGDMFASDVRHRIIVRAQYGDIRNGSEWKEDRRTRVFTLEAERDRWGGEIKLDYIAPIGRESDHLTVWSSCDVSHLPVRHPSIAEKHQVIGEQDISICGGYKLEYAHEFTIEHGGAGLLYSLVGEVPLRLVDAVYENDRVVAGRLEGNATLPVVMAGNFRDCTVTYTNQMSVQVKGEIRLEGMMPPRPVIQVELTENYGTVGSGVIDCPDQEPFATGGVPTPTITQGNEAQLVFQHEEGNTITRPFQADEVTGNAVWIIHVPER